MAQTIISTSSVSSILPQFDQPNLAVVNHLANWLENLGFSIHISPITDKQGKANIIATLGDGEGGLLLSGHTDTVPCDEDLWLTQPFQLVTKNNRWYGLGVCDMKSFLALCIAAVEPFIGKPLKHPLVILGTADEESCMSGAKQLTLQELSRPQYAVIGEPTNLIPINRHKSFAVIKLKVSGHSGHSSDPSLGNNALEATGHMINALCDFKQALAVHYLDRHFAVQYPTLNLGCIHGGDNPNRICDHVQLSFDLRLLPGMDQAAMLEQIDKCLAPKLLDTGLTMDLSLLHPATPAFDNTAPELVHFCETLCGQRSGAVAFATEAPFLANLGIETIVMGPGSINQAHQPNEYLDLAQIEPSIAIIRSLIHQYCCQ